MPQDNISGLVFNIQKYSLHDGPGVRTIVFLKGCPLHCLWCSNPESISPAPQILASAQNCTQCGSCARLCPQHIHRMDSGQHTMVYREQCLGCGLCVQHCPAHALLLSGQNMGVSTIMRTVLQDQMFYHSSGGGLTLSGGEAALQKDFCSALLKQCRAEGVHTALETCGHVPWASLEALAPYVDIFLYDVKHTHSATHKALTGVGNERIQENLHLLARAHYPFILRMPLIPGHNDDSPHLRSMAALINELCQQQAALREVQLLPYHRYGEGKYAQLGQKYPLEGCESYTPEDMSRIEADVSAQVEKVPVRMVRH